MHRVVKYDEFKVHYFTFEIPFALTMKSFKYYFLGSTNDCDYLHESISLVYIYLIEKNNKLYFIMEVLCVKKL